VQRSRFIVGLILIAAAALILVLRGMDYSVAGPVALGVLGLTLVAISRRKADRRP
jgi:hypothetical protein